MLHQEQPWTFIPPRSPWLFDRVVNVKLSPHEIDYVTVGVKYSTGGVVFDVSGTGTIQMAFMPDGLIPQASDWHNGVWDLTATPFEGNVAKCLVGSTFTLPEGSYKVWVQVVYSGMTVVRNVGDLVIGY